MKWTHVISCYFRSYRTHAVLDHGGGCAAFGSNQFEGIVTYVFILLPFNDNTLIYR